MVKPRIIFVDDEPNVLNGLRRMLRHRRDVWDMTFFDDARRALASCVGDPATVVVTDMRMPGMDGLALIDGLQAQCPETIRFVLSGYSAEEAGLRAAGIAHRFLSKPTDGTTLVAAIDQALSLRQRLGGDDIVQLVGRMAVIPALPDTYQELTGQLRGDMLDTDAIAATVSKDPGIAARLVQVANSSYFGAPRRIASVRGAVEFLGIETLKSLVLTHGIVSQMAHHEIDGVPVAQRLVDRMVMTSRVAARIAGDLKPDRVDEEFVATLGLFADVGLLVLIQNFPEAFGQWGEFEALGRDALLQFERDTFGVPHALVGAYLLGTWGLPDPLASAVAELADNSVGDLSTSAQIVTFASKVLAQDDMTAFAEIGPIEKWVEFANSLNSN
jgi:HD-like signal output (HDOD) protein/CheY-like chemotaxis protein